MIVGEGLDRRWRAGTGDLAERLIQQDHILRLALMLILLLPHITKEETPACAYGGAETWTDVPAIEIMIRSTPRLLCRGTGSLIKGPGWAVKEPG
jgi:hypothetical protein